jgi:RNA polymerase sigma-70 factor (ECF subfamily)
VTLRVPKAATPYVTARLLAELPVRNREAVVLRHVEGLSYAEVAEVLGQPVGTVKTNVHRGLRRLREALHAGEEAVSR